MKIQGYKPGTEVRWQNETEDGFRTGIVRARYYDPDITEINGERIEINVIANSPAYKVRESRTNTMIIIDHKQVTLKQTNE